MINVKRRHWLLFCWLSQDTVQIKWGSGRLKGGSGKCQSGGSWETVPQRQVNL